MNADERQFLLTVVWMFMRHGQRARALAVCEALCEENPRDGVAAVALAELLLDSSEAARALEALQTVLETRALKMLGRQREAAERWRRYLETRKGDARQWMA